MSFTMFNLNGSNQEKVNRWRERWLSTARHFSTFSLDPSTKVGAVVVKDNRLLAQGWNGFPRGIKDDERLADREVKHRYVVHAEMNAIYNAAYYGISIKDSELYVYGLPVCSECAKGVVQSGITRVHMMVPRANVTQRWKDSWVLSAAMFDEAGVAHELNEV